VIFPTVATTKFGVGVTAIPAGKWMVELKTNGNGPDTCWRALKLSTANTTANVTLNGTAKNAANFFVMSNDTGAGFIFSTGTLANPGIGTERMRILSTNGFVGIGTTTIGSKLQINGNAAIGYSASTAAPANGLAVNGPIVIGTTNAPGTNSNFQINGGAAIGYSVSTAVPTNGLVVNGQVGIGTTSTGTFKLAVEGKIGAREVVVTQTTPWPDFVFDKGYKLQSLDKVEKQIITRGHLENIPTRDEVKNNGVAVGEMQAKLLQKIEEMTLYLISLKKENDLLKSRLTTIEKKVR
jgi:hypothetical protein